MPLLVVKILNEVYFDLTYAVLNICFPNSMIQTYFMVSPMVGRALLLTYPAYAKDLRFTLNFHPFVVIGLQWIFLAIIIQDLRNFDHTNNQQLNKNTI